jgi:hypothetical protein
MSGPVYLTKTRNYHSDIEALRSSIGLSTWPNNGLRHSFASYRLAKHQNAPQLALEMNEFITLASVWTSAQFLESDMLSGPTLGLRIAAGNVPNFVDLATGGYGEAIQDALNCGQSRVSSERS